MKYFFPHKMTEEVISERQKRQGNVGMGGEGQMCCRKWKKELSGEFLDIIKALL